MVEVDAFALQSALLKPTKVVPNPYGEAEFETKVPKTQGPSPVQSGCPRAVAGATTA